MDSVALIVMAVISLVCVATLATVLLRVTYAMTALTSKDSAETLAEVIRPSKPARQQVEVPADMQNPAWSTDFARDMTDVADPHRNGVA